MRNIPKRFFAFFIAFIIVFGGFMQFLPTVMRAEETKNFSQSAYNFEYQNLLLDVGDGTTTLLPRDSDYNTVTGRNGGKASSSGAKLDPVLFAGKSDLTLSFWVSLSSGSSDSVPYSNAKKLIETLQEQVSSMSSAYTSVSVERLLKAIGDLQQSLDSGSSPATVVKGIESVVSAKNSLVKIYTVSEAASVLSDAEKINENEYTESSFSAFAAARSSLSAAVSSGSSSVSDNVANLLEKQESLEYKDYKKQAEHELEKFKKRFSDLDGEIYTKDSYSALSSAISDLASSLSSSDDVLRSKVSAVSAAFSGLKATAGSANEIFYAVGNSDKNYIKISRSGSDITVSLHFGGSAETVSHSVKSASGFTMITLTAKASSGKTAVSLYINGSEVEKKTVSGDLASFEASSAEFPSSVTVDDIYVASKVLTSSEVKNLFEKSIEDFLKLMDPNWVKPSDRINVNPVENFKWSAYTFNNGFKIDSDLNGVAACSYNAIKLAPIDTTDYGGKYGMGLVRRNGIYPTYYMSLGRGLLSSASSFTVAGFVSNVGGAGTSANFFEFSGKNGKLVFSPFSSGGGFFEYTSSGGQTKRESFSSSDINSKWVHFALTFASDGNVIAYVNGKSVASFSTGISLSTLSLNSFKIISGITSGEAARLIIDDIYVSSKVMSDSDIRKMSYYGVERFVGEVLPDPDTGEIDSDNKDINLDADETDELEDSYSDTAAINGYIGTTFDDASFMGEDYNGAVSATIRNASLVQGQYKYGLNLNGKTAYVRYPKDILNSVSELTVSIAYNWTTPSSINERNQKLFAFANKSSSVSDPKSYIYLDMGNGTDGMKLCLSDGNETADIPIKVNAVSEWKRLTVTIKNGHVKVYSDKDLVAEKKTGIDLTAIAPNFNYVGKSCYKGDPLFCGVVDEIYISDKEISEKEIENLMSGIAPSAEEEKNKDASSGDVWDGIIIGTVIFMGLLFAGFIGFIVYTLFFKK